MRKVEDSERESQIQPLSKKKKDRREQESHELKRRAC